MSKQRPTVHDQDWQTYVFLPSAIGKQTFIPSLMLELDSVGHDRIRWHCNDCYSYGKWTDLQTKTNVEWDVFGNGYIHSLDCKKRPIASGGRPTPKRVANRVHIGSVVN